MIRASGQHLLTVDQSDASKVQSSTSQVQSSLAKGEGTERFWGRAGGCKAMRKRKSRMKRTDREAEARYTILTLGLWISLPK